MKPAPSSLPANRPAAAPFIAIAKPIGPICNLRCEYCFYLDKTSLFPTTRSYRMSEGVLEAFVSQYIASQPAGVTEVQFIWQGGEPTL
ncbi:MAG: anaerobic sulfatase maturase, partial [Candidatus Neomarinimicrobiota bacterium]